MLGTRSATWACVGVALGFAWLGGACSADKPEKSAPPAPDPSLAADERGLSRRELLGKRLFEDTSLSEPPGQACASCHDPARAFGGNADAPDEPVAIGASGEEVGERNAPSLMYARFAPPFGVTVEETPREGFALAPHGGLFWDGRASSVEEQAKLPLLHRREMANVDEDAVVRKVREGRSSTLFAEVFPSEPSKESADVHAAFDQVGSAIGAYLRTPRFAPFSSRFDAWLRGQGSLGALELRGKALFEDRKKGNCASCHARKPGSREPRDWLFTGWTYEALGVPRNPRIPANDDADAYDLGLCARPDLAAVLPHQIEPSDFCGAFRVPSLRNVAVTAPYMHNGYFTDLTDVVRFYATRDTSPERWYLEGPDGTIDKFDDIPPEHRQNVNTFEIPYDRRPGQAPRLDEDEIHAIVAFLETLTDE